MPRFHIFKTNCILTLLQRGMTNFVISKLSLLFLSAVLYLFVDCYIGNELKEIVCSREYRFEYMRVISSYYLSSLAGLYQFEFSYCFIISRKAKCLKIRAEFHGIIWMRNVEKYFTYFYVRLGIRCDYSD